MQLLFIMILKKIFAFQLGKESFNISIIKKSVLAPSGDDVFIGDIILIIGFLIKKFKEET